jgi:hypothetical protein
VGGEGSRVPALDAVLAQALHAEAPATRAAAVGVVERYCEGNCEGQLLLAASVTPVAEATGSSFGAVCGPIRPTEGGSPLIEAAH